MDTTEIPHAVFFQEAGEKIRQQVATKIGFTGLRTNDRGNVMEISMTGLRGCHYEIAFHKDCHEIALHFQGTPENNLSRSEGFRSSLQNLETNLGYPLILGPHEGAKNGRKRLWIKLPLHVCNQDLLEMYSNLTSRLIIVTFPILKSILYGENLA
jgi:hypothetical protein